MKILWIWKGLISRRHGQLPGLPNGAVCMSNPTGFSLEWVALGRNRQRDLLRLALWQKSGWESEKKHRKSAGSWFSVFVFRREASLWEPPQGWLGWSNADLSAFELPASYCAEALLTLKYWRGWVYAQPLLITFISDFYACHSMYLYTNIYRNKGNYPNYNV